MTIALRHAETREELLACHAVMRQLRPHRADADDFITRVERMRAQSYRLLAAWQGGKVVALAGYRLPENLIFGRFLYVDDLVADEDVRGEGLGALLLETLTETAKESGCTQLVLDTGLSNALAQRFYFRQGLLTCAIGFYKLTGAPAA